MKILLIRHGKTEGNLHGRYIGRTDEPLCPSGREALEKLYSGEGDQKMLKDCKLLFASPMKRCVETAGILFPGIRPILTDKLKECDFGIFENRNYLELSDEPKYQEWIDSMGTMDFPEGEKTDAFKQRCREGFLEAVRIAEEKQASSAAFVVHGGTIMAVCEAFALPEKEYFSWQVKNGSMLIFETVGGTQGRFLLEVPAAVKEE